MKTLPKTLYVALKEKGTENEYLHASADIDVFDNFDVVGIYYQDELTRMVINHELRTIKRKKK